MIRKRSAINIINAANQILLDKEDALDMETILKKSSEFHVVLCYKSYINEIIRQCFKNN